MTLLFVDGFDHYATADITKKWTTSASASISAAAGRRAGGAAAIPANASSSMVKSGLGNAATLVVGFAYNPSGALNGSTTICELRDAGTVQLFMRYNMDTTLSVVRGSTVLGTTSATFALSAWHYIELKATIHDTTGSFEVRVNGASVLSATSQDTKNGSNAYVNEVALRANQYATSLFDDFYVCDTSGSANNDFLGDCRVDTIYPTGDGTYSQWTPSTGTSHYAMVDEAAPNTSDYNAGANVGDRDSYTLGDLSALTNSTVYGVQVSAAMLKDDAGAKSAAVFVRSGSTNGDGTAAALGTSQGYVRQVYETNPNGSVAWTEATVNAVEVGVLVSA
ncbi:hypothetical protein GPA27_13400 [Aromatoleum toluolicum]|uniref:Uncharacterized protein n=1 Tax=Aromatoleum toluolicum TaxID=90060 RepID=A0ABX1NGE9_9RHOO|nr:hypothetical protein [Aromatoleum toluolicum]NMF98381.1 hypothetical protein [Aromatoleum toluolicum]